MFKKLKALAVTSIAALALSFVPAQAALAQSDDTSFTTREVLQGVVFTQGPVAKNLGIEVERPADISAAESAAVAEVEEILLNSMISADGDKLDIAAVNVQSGDPYVVEDALEVMRTSFLSALDREYPGVTDTPLVGTMCGAIAACVSIAVVAVGAAIMAVTYNVAGAINIIYNQNGLWNENGYWHGSEAPDTSSAVASRPQYPDLSSGEVIRRITVGLSNK